MIIVTLYVALFSGMKKIQTSYTDQFEYLNDNQIRVYNLYGFKTEEQQAITNIQGVTKAEFSNTPVLAHYYLSGEEDVKSGYLRDAYGFVIPQDSQYQKELEFIEGTYLTDTNQVIISEQLAEGITKYSDVPRNQVLGSNFGHNLTIVGIYKDDDLDGYFVKNYVGSAPEFDEVQYDKSFYTFNMQQQLSKDLVINTINYDSEMYDYEKFVTDCGPNKVNESQITNEDYFLYSDYYLYTSGCMVDYEASIAKGAEGLIDPNTTEYGEQFNQYLLLTVDEQSKESIISELETMLPNAGIVTKNTQYSDFKNVNENKRLMVVSMIVIVVMIFVPRIELKKRKK